MFSAIAPNPLRSLVAAQTVTLSSVKGWEGDDDPPIPSLPDLEITYGAGTVPVRIPEEDQPKEPA